jgi:hypothetical protein
MEDKIYSVLEKYGIDEPKASAITEDLLVLCAVSRQRELLLAYHKHLDSFNDPSIYNATENMIDDYLANNCV